MTHVTCRLTAKNQDKLWNPTLEYGLPLLFLNRVHRQPATPKRIRLRITTVGKCIHAQVWTPRCLFHGEFRPLSNTQFLEPTRVHNQNGTAGFVGLTNVSNWQTHRPHYMYNNRPHLCIATAQKRRPATQNSVCVLCQNQTSETISGTQSLTSHQVGT